MPTSPINPEPNSHIAAGTGTAETVADQEYRAPGPLPVQESVAGVGSNPPTPSSKVPTPVSSNWVAFCAFTVMLVNDSVNAPSVQLRGSGFRGEKSNSARARPPEVVPIKSPVAARTTSLSIWTCVALARSLFGSGLGVKSPR